MKFAASNADLHSHLERLKAHSHSLSRRLTVAHSRFVADVAQHQGTRDVQQDSVAFVELPGSRSRAVAVIADGIGGLEAGDVASTVAVASFCRSIRNANGSGAEELRQALFAANDAILARKREMGTTLTACVVDARSIRWISVGDSRAYLITSHGIQQLTQDHVMEAARAATGQWIPSRALSSFLGATEIAEINEGEIPHVLRQGDCLVLCTDGVHGIVSAQQLTSAATHASPAEQIIHSVIAEQNNPQDNATVLVVSQTAFSTNGLVERLRSLLSDRLRTLRLSGSAVFALIVAILLFFMWWTTRYQNEQYGITPRHREETQESRSSTPIAQQSNSNESVSAQTDPALPHVGLSSTASVSPLPPAAVQATDDVVVQKHADSQSSQSHAQNQANSSVLAMTDTAQTNSAPSAEFAEQKSSEQQNSSITTSTETQERPTFYGGAVAPPEARSSSAASQTAPASDSTHRELPRPAETRSSKQAGFPWQDLVRNLPLPPAPHEIHRRVRR